MTCKGEKTGEMHPPLRSRRSQRYPWTSGPVVCPSAAQRTRWAVSAPCTQPSSPRTQPSGRQQPETTSLYRIVREHLEAYLALARGVDPMADGVPTHVEHDFLSYLRCGILGHGFARARCTSRGYDFPAAFSCKGRATWPSCNARRMAQAATLRVGHVFSHVSLCQDPPPASYPPPP